MRHPVSALALATATALALTACHKPEPAAPAPPPPKPVATVPAPAPPPLPEAPPLPGQPAFPPAGSSYAEARAMLLKQGLSPYLFATGAPGHPECERRSRRCAFVWTDPKTHLATYLLVSVDPGFKSVEVAGFASHDEELALALAPLNQPAPMADLPLQPPVNPYARDSGRIGWTTQRLPNIAGPYLAARDKLTAAGFSPVPGKAPACKPPPKPAAAPPPGAAPTSGAALPPAEPPAPVICRPPGAPPEIHGCAIGALTACQAVWSRDNQVLVVNTAGEPAPGAIDNMYWATAAEAAAFKAGRK